jgi:hypothetical protein
MVTQSGYKISYLVASYTHIYTHTPIVQWRPLSDTNLRVVRKISREDWMFYENPD